MKSVKIIATGGGTGGHIIPTLSVINKLKELADIEILYVGSATGMEATIVPAHGIAFRGIHCGKLRRYFSLENFTDMFKVCAGFFQSLNIIRSFKPDVIFAKGGYVTVPVGLAGGILGIPVIAHESDTVIGLSNKILLRFLRGISLGFPEDNYPAEVQKKGKYTGSPINPAVMKIAFTEKSEGVKHFGLDPAIPVLFVTGGSQGARAINNAIKDILPALLPSVQVLHQSGELDYPSLCEMRETLPENLKKNYKLFSFITDDMPLALQSADLVLTRGGANTLSELMVLKKPSVIIPLPKAANNHQMKNARVIEQHGAGIIIEQSLLTEDLLLKTIKDLIADREKLKNMSGKAASLAKPDAAELIAKTILSVNRNA
ncbi:MAG: undecaprenyldiphospho-muramoylpentapeptide beta-N-acetylglucosaminyltransferase [Candidatus Eremiobacterota bacterium]